MTSGTGIVPGGVATEESVPEPGTLGAFRFANEEAAVAFNARGVRASVVRFPRSVHGQGDHGFVARLIDIARNKGVSAYPGDGLNRWPAVHRLDGAHLFRLALEGAPAGARLHGVGDEGIPVREIAAVIGRHLGLPVTSVSLERADDHFGFLGRIFAWDCPASSTQTQKLIGWRPVQPGLIADMELGHYFARVKTPA
jgi:nucleoside-diphosphate-sugar epimerase